jgi:SPP1 family predicted phage head-tail adaptor
MRSGSLDRLIVIKSPKTETNGYGEEVTTTYSPLATVWAKRLELKGDEKWVSQQVLATTACKYQIRYRTDVTPLCVIVSDSKTYDIHSIVEIGRREGLELTCTARDEI